MNKKVVLLIILLPVVCLYATKTLGQYVRNWPDNYDTTGIHWVVYDISNPEEDTAFETSFMSFTLYSAAGDLIKWAIDVGNFPTQWLKGDSLLAFGSWDSVAARDPVGYPDNPNHTGFYWLFTDTLTTEEPQDWRDDTLRVLPKPNVYKTGIGGGANDTIWVEIPNPRETRYTGQAVYDVLGYWLWADSTGTGTPNEFNASSAMEIGFIPVDGVYGETTVYWQLESEGFLAWDHWTTYFAYKLVARPDTTGSDDPGSPGYSTYYFSQNSDAIDVYQIVIGIEENKDINHSSMQFEISPNPFTDRIDIRFQITENQMQDVRSKNQEASLEIYDCSGRLVKSFNLTSVILLHASAVPWYGTDESGELLPSGVYFVQVKGGDLNLTKKVILQRK